MTVKELAEGLNLKILVEDGLGKTIDTVYCCDLLSVVMGRAPADCAWVTVMGNVNAIAVAVLSDTACIVLAEGAALDEQAKQKAVLSEIPVLWTEQPVFPICKAIDGLL